MINGGILVLCLINFGFIALLPRKFFKQNAKLTAQFWLTAGPMFACPAFLMLSFYGVLTPLWDYTTAWGQFISYIAVAINCTSIVLLGMAIGTHRVPIHMFHDQEDQNVSHLVTYGPYRHVRHPIYSSYLFALFGSVLFCPQIGTLLCFLYGAVVLNNTAAKEEVRLSSSSEFGDEYVQYIKNSGRFLPPLSAIDLGFSNKDSGDSGTNLGSTGEAAEEKSQVGS